MNDPLLKAIMFDGTEYYNGPSLEELLKKGVIVNKRADEPEEQVAGVGEGWVVSKGDTALHLACGGELSYWPAPVFVLRKNPPDVDYVKKLLKHGAGINIKNDNDQTALDVAHKALKRYKGHGGAAARASEKRCKEIISILTLQTVKQRLAFVHAMNNYNLNLDVLNKIGEMHLSLHE